MTQQRIIDHIHQAYNGLYVWVLDTSDKGFASDGTRIAGLGVFRIKQIEKGTRHTITVDGLKYDRLSGYQLGVHAVVANRIFGAIEKQDFELVRLHRNKIADMIRTEESPDKLRAVANAIGFELQGESA